MKRFTRSIAEVWRLLEPRAQLGIYPFEYTSYEDTRRILTSLTSLDPEPWARAFCDVASPFEEKAREAEFRGDSDSAKQLYLRAWGLYRLARFPSPKVREKTAAYQKSQEMYLSAARFYKVPVERIRIPFTGRPSEGDSVVAYFRRPKSDEPLPILLLWTGIDAFKDQVDRFVDPIVDAGVSAVLVFDIPGTLDAPVCGSQDGERMWDAVFNWIATRGDLDSRRIVGWGISTGGYLAAKVAHTHANQFRAVVNHGGAAHYSFTPERIEPAQYGIYPFHLAETLASVVGLNTFEEWLDGAKFLSF
jgi:esterase FrsA